MHTPAFADWVIICEDDRRRYYRFETPASSAKHASDLARARGHHAVIAYPALARRRDVNRALRRLRTGWHRCSACRYPLKGLRTPASQRIDCPECGHPDEYGDTPAELQREIGAWRLREGRISARSIIVTILVLFVTITLSVLIFLIGGMPR
jgi:hypothetical protein